MTDLANFKLTEEQKSWFAQRMNESANGNVLIPTYLVNKFKKIADDESLSVHAVKGYLVGHCY